MNKQPLQKPALLVDELREIHKKNLETQKRAASLRDMEEKGKALGLRREKLNMREKLLRALGL